MSASRKFNTGGLDLVRATTAIRNSAAFLKQTPVGTWVFDTDEQSMYLVSLSEDGVTKVISALNETCGGAIVGGAIAANVFVCVDAANPGKVKLPGAGARAIGITTHATTAAGQKQRFVVAGPAVLLAPGGAGWTAGDRIKTDAAGKGVTAVAGDISMAEALTTVAAGQSGIVILTGASKIT